MKTEFRRVVFLLNPRAGNGRTHGLVERLRGKSAALGLRERALTDALRLRGALLVMERDEAGAGAAARPAFGVEVYRSTAVGQLRVLGEDFVRLYGEALLLVACGGDGTVNEVAQAAQGGGAALLVIPFGSGNDFVKSIYPPARRHSASILEALGLARAPRGGGPAHAAERAAADPPPVWPPVELRRVDTVDFCDAEGVRRCLVNVMSIGFDSKVAALASRLVRRFPGLGKLAYLLAVIPALFMRRNFKLRYDFAGRRWADPERPERLGGAAEPQTLGGELDYALAALGNARYYGGGFQPNPYFDLEDGEIEAAISRPLGFGRIAGLIGAYRRGRAQASGVLRMFSLRSGRIASADAEDLAITYDGEVLYTREIRFEVKAAALRLACPIFPDKG